jgi:cyanate permease
MSKTMQAFLLALALLHTIGLFLAYNQHATALTICCGVIAVFYYGLYIINKDHKNP